MKLNKQTTEAQIDGIGAVAFEPFERAGEYWRRNYGRTHQQRFSFTVKGRDYWGEIVRTHDKEAPRGQRVNVDVELRTHSGTRGARALPETAKPEWRKELRNAFKAHLEAWLAANETDIAAEAADVPAEPTHYLIIRAKDSAGSAVPVIAADEADAMRQAATMGIAANVTRVDVAMSKAEWDAASADVPAEAAPLPAAAQDVIATALVHDAIARAPDQTLTDDDGVTFGLTGADWEPDEATRYYAQRGEGVAYFAPTAIEARRLLAEAETNAKVAAEAEASADDVAEAIDTLGAKVVGMIDLTPTWVAVMPVFIMALESGTATGRAAAREELMRVAALADERNAMAAARKAETISDKAPDDESIGDIRTEVPITWQRVADMVTNAIESNACDYWLNVYDVPRVEGYESPRYADPKFWRDGHSIAVTYDNPESGPDTLTKPLDIAAIRQGLQLMAIKSPSHFADLVQENDDAITADVFIQYALLGEIVYG